MHGRKRKLIMLALFAIIQLKMATKPKITVMPEKPKRFTKKRVLVGASVLVVLALLGGGVWAWLAHRSDNKDGTQKPLTQEQVTKAVDHAFASNDYNSAIDTLKSQPQDTQTQLMLASAYVNKKDYKNALAIYAKLDSEGKMTVGYLPGAGAVAEQAKDYKTALKYYQEAKTQTLAQKDQIPTWKDDVAQFNTSIKRVQKKL